MSDCLFCGFARGEGDVHVVLESDDALAFLDNCPATPYHTLVIPKRHSTNLFDVPEADLHAVMSLVKRVADLYRDRLGVENAEVVHCAGAEAQQAVFHLHVHVVPRSAGDGQDTDWRRHPEWHDRFDEMLARLRPEADGAGPRRTVQGRNTRRGGA